MSYPSSNDLVDRIANDGFAVVPDVLTHLDVDHLRDALNRLPVGHSAQRRSGVYAARGLLERLPEVAELAGSIIAQRLVEPVLGDFWRPVRAIYFDKTPSANWKVPWHQDLTIAVQRRIDTSGYGPWSTKNGVPHVQPPIEIMEQMVSLRFALDNNDESNAPLRVLPGTHQLGRISGDDIARLRADRVEQICCVPVGGVVMMRPLLLHASSAMVSGNRRRVIHIEFAGGELDGGLRWRTGNLQLIIGNG